MFGKRAALYCLALPCLALAAHVVEDVALPLGWTMAAKPDDDQPMRLQVGLVQQSVDRMIARLYAVSTPGDSCYGQHLQHHEVNDMVKPKKESEEKVVAWLRSAGVKAIKSDGHWVQFDTTVGAANILLDTEFLDYRKGDTLRRGTTRYSVPDHLAHDVDLITPTTYFSSIKRHSPTPDLVNKDETSLEARAFSCTNYLKPVCVREMYQVHTSASGTSGSRVAFGSFLEQRAQKADLAKYEQRNHVPMTPLNVVSIDGAKDNQHAPFSNITEANLDAQNIAGVGRGLPLTEFILDGNAPFVPNAEEGRGKDKLFPNENEPYLQYYQYLLSQPNSALPQVISNSYGDDEQTVPYKYARRVCNMIAMMGTRGITILESSGDDGVGDVCVTNNKNGPQRAQFTPIFPASCPYLTSVGGTENYPPPEAAWNSSSGGFSNYFNRPQYQDTTIHKYFAHHIDPNTLAYYQPYFHMQGRGFPDVSAHSAYPSYLLYYKGQLGSASGTSAASPVWAAIVGLLNDARLNAGMPALGFLNPWLYSSGYKALHDITTGGSIGCTGRNPQFGNVKIEGAMVIPYASWNATVGWDPVTGLGTPDLTALTAQVLAMGASKRSACSV